MLGIYHSIMIKNRVVFAVLLVLTTITIMKQKIIMNGGPGLRSTGLQPLTPVNPAAHRTRSETRAPTSQPVEPAAIDAGEWAETCILISILFCNWRQLILSAPPLLLCQVASILVPDPDSRWAR